MKYLFICAHPDDEAYGCGGTIQKLSKDNEVFLCTVTDGGNKMEHINYVHESGKILGIDDITLLSVKYEDQKLDIEPIKKLIDHLTIIIEYHKPDVVVTHSITDLNKDHRIVAEAVLVATRPKPKCSVKEVWSFEIISSTDWAFGQFGSFEPNLFVTFDNLMMNEKIKAIGVYKKELEDFPHARSFPAVYNISERRSSTVSNETNTEAFKIIRKVM